MKDFWNERFAQKEFIYGTAPNDFFRQEIDRLEPGSLLLPAEGEGRNAVYAAQKGWQVFAFDYAEAARQKALQLAARQAVPIQYVVASYEEIELPAASFDALALIYAHTDGWQSIYPRLFRALRPGGTLIVELFAPAQPGALPVVPSKPPFWFLPLRCKPCSTTSQKAGYGKKKSS